MSDVINGVYYSTYGIGSECTSTCSVSVTLFVCFFVCVPEFLVGCKKYHGQLHSYPCRRRVVKRRKNFIFSLIYRRRIIAVRLVHVLRLRRIAGDQRMRRRRSDGLERRTDRGVWKRSPFYRTRGEKRTRFPRGIFLRLTGTIDDECGN